MRFRQLVATFLIPGALVGRTSGAEAGDDPGRKPVDAAMVAKLPAPGTVVPGAIAFTPDGRAVTYLKAESASLSRVLWRADVDGGIPRVVARPPGSGDTDANVSQAEALRRERQRLRDTGITQVARARQADVAVIPLGGDLYLLKGSNGPLERLTQTPSPEIDPQLSDDGTQVAFVRDNELHVIELGSRRETSLSNGSADGLTHGLAEFMAQEEMDRFRGFWWAPDGLRVAYQETDERHIPLYSIVHQGAGDVTVETHRYPFPGQANAKVKLGVVSAKGGETRWLSLPTEGDDVYLARVAWQDPKHLLIQLLSRDQRSLKLWRVDVDTSQATLLVEETAPTWVNLHNDLRVVPGTGELVWSTEASGSRQLVLLDRDGKRVRTLTEGCGIVDGIDHLDAKRREVWFSSGMPTPLERRVFRVSLDGGPAVPVTTTPGTHRVVVAGDGNFYVDTHSSLTVPPVTRLLARDGRVVSVLDDAGTADARVAEYRLIPPEIVTFRGREGTEFFGAYYAPRSKRLGGKAALVVLLYGGPHVQYVSDTWALTADMNAQHLADRGFAVWKMDNRGSSRRGHAWEAALHERMGTVEVQDQVDGVRFIARTKPEIDASRVGVTGSSYGGYMTLRCLLEAPEVFQAGVSLAPVTDWDGYDTCYTERYMSTPQKNASGYAGSSVLGKVDRLRGELLIIHGMIDENVHFRHTARLAAALVAAGKTFRLIPLADERHSTRKEENRKYVVDQLTGFFEKSLTVARVK
jgi:dipeptidyl-peptidase-4